MPKFRKKPVVIEAVQWLGENDSWKEIIAMGLKNWKPGKLVIEKHHIESFLQC